MDVFHYVYKFSSLDLFIMAGPPDISVGRKWRKLLYGYIPDFSYFTTIGSTCCNVCGPLLANLSIKIDLFVFILEDDLLLHYVIVT